MTEDFERLSKEVKRLERLVEGRDAEIRRLGATLTESEAENDQWQQKVAELWAEVERLKPSGHTPTCACQLCLRVYGPVKDRA